MARPRTLTSETKKSARVSLLMTPQMLDDVTTLARIQQVSINDLFLTLAAQIIKKNRSAIDEVQGVMQKVSPDVQMSLFED